MGERYLPWTNRAASAHKSCQRRAVVRAAKGPHAPDELIDGLSRHRVHHRRLQHLVSAERGQDGGHARGEHRLARTWRPHHEQPMVACSGDLESSLCHFMSSHIAVVCTSYASTFTGDSTTAVALETRSRTALMKSAAQMPDTENAHIVQGHRIALGRAHEIKPQRTSAYGARQRTGHRTHPPIEGEFANKQRTCRPRRIYLPSSRQYAQGNGKIKSRAGLLQATGSQVHHNLLIGNSKACGSNSRLHALSGLLNGGIGHPHDGHSRQPGRHHHLYGDGNHLHPAHRRARHSTLSEHHGAKPPKKRQGDDAPEHDRGRSPQWR